MGRIRSLNLVLLLGLLCFQNTEFTLCNGAPATGCVAGERQALLKFKGELTDPNKLLSSWVGEDCCNWKGVDCNNSTWHVVKIDIRYQHLYDGLNNEWRLGGKVDPSLLDLKYLNYLDLSSNNFRGTSIPEFIGSLTNLRYLNLSNAGFGGMIPHQLGNLSRLQYLDLNSFYSLHDLNVDENLQWLSGLASLEYLDMSRVNFVKTADWLLAVNMLPSLSVLHLAYCKLDSIPTSLPFVNFTSLTILDLSGNQFNSMIPFWMFNISSLEYVNLQFNNFHGPIPDTFTNMTSLEVLQLGDNGFSGVIPRTIKDLCNLRTLDLSFNNLNGEINVLAEILVGCVGESLEKLNLRSNKLSGNLNYWLTLLKNIVILDLSDNLLSGPIPASLGRITTLRILILSQNGLSGAVPEIIGQLLELNVLDVSFNSLKGALSEAHFANLTKLRELSMTSNSLVLNMSLDWVPPFQLNVIGLRCCILGPKFPPWLKTQKDFTILDLSNASISDTMPDWFWSLSNHIALLDLSRNQITGKVPTYLKFASISIMNLGYNKFDGLLPPLPSNIEYLDLSNNLFTGDLSILEDTYPILSNLFLSNNLIEGKIPVSICKLGQMEGLDLSGNHISGELPQCWTDIKSLLAINLAKNSLSGEIPSSMGSLSRLQALHLGNNSLSGEIPFSLKNCKSLAIIDLGDNGFTGNIPSWVGESLVSLKILRLRSNKFSGDIPPQLSHLTNLQILDLAYNNLSGTIPQNFGDFKGMAITQKANTSILDGIVRGVSTSIDDFGPLGYQERLLVVMKGRELEYSKNLQYVTSIDFSSNHLWGQIPKQVTDLFGLRSLNLSGNELTGKIPDKIGGLLLLESLDLSRNQLSGPIPPGMSAMTSLSHLNLSYNNLSGRIPSGYQLQTLDDPSIYTGNINLCGPPLTEMCERNETSKGPLPAGVDKEDESDSEMLWFYLSMALGFVVGFWSICGALLFKEAWRDVYFQFIDCMNYQIYMAVARRAAR